MPGLLRALFGIICSSRVSIHTYSESCVSPLSYVASGLTPDFDTPSFWSNDDVFRFIR